MILLDRRLVAVRASSAVTSKKPTPIPIRNPDTDAFPSATPGLGNAAIPKHASAIANHVLSRPLADKIAIRFSVRSGTG